MGPGYAETTRQPQVTEEVMALTEAVSSVEEKLKMVRERFSKALVINPPNKKVGGLETVERVLVPLAQQIREQRFRVQGVRDDLQEIFDTCEL